MIPEHKAPPPGIDRDIEMISAALEELRQLASGRKNAQDDAKIYDFSIRWGVLLSGRLERLEHYNRAGDLNQDQERRYRELRRELDEAAPQAERLDIARPNVAPADQYHPRQG
jgi:hypothetical protein